MKSRSGSWPRKESLKPPLPFLFPWQVPALQPAFETTGITSLRKDTFSDVRAGSARHGLPAAKITARKALKYNGNRGNEDIRRFHRKSLHGESNSLEENKKKSGLGDSQAAFLNE
jgi:hypothetical protein